MLLPLLLAASCGGEAPEPEARPAAETGLVATLEVRVVGDTAHFGLHLSNATDAPLELEFATTQRYDFAVRTETGTELWRWSADQAFAQVLGTEQVPVGGSLEYHASWALEPAPARLEAEARLTSTTVPLVLRTEFEVRAGESG